MYRRYHLQLKCNIYIWNLFIYNIFALVVGGEYCRADYMEWKFTWCPEQTDPFGMRTLKGLCTGQVDRGPHRDGPGIGTELKLLEFVLQGLQRGGGGTGGPWNAEWAPWVAGPPPPTPMPPMIGGPGPGPWWHIGPPQFGIGPHWPLPPPPKLLTRPPPQNWSAAKLSWLPEHCSRWGGGGDDCRE